MLRTHSVAGSAAAIFAAAIGPRPVLDRPNEGGAADVLREFTALHKDVRGALTEAGALTRELDVRLTDLEQKSQRGFGRGELARPQTWGEQVVSAPELKSFAENTSRPGRVRFDVKATITTSTADAAGSAGALVPASRDPSIAMMPKQRMTIRSLLNVVSVSTGTVEYVRQASQAQNAGMVAEAYEKPQSDIKFELESVPTRVVAHWSAASRQILEDVPQLRDVIDGELRYGLQKKEEGQLLNGDGSGQNLLGIAPQATAFSAPITLSSPTMLDNLGLALLQTTLAGYRPDGIIMHPSDWLRLRLMKASDGTYLFGDPQNAVEPRIFGVPVVESESIAIDKALVGNFFEGATLYDRWQPRVELATEHADFFVRNLVAILAEERIGLAVKYPAAFTFIDFGNVA